MRIATWNMDGKWHPAHLELLGALDADVLLLTEVHRDAAIIGYEQQRTQASIKGTNSSWSAIVSRVGLTPLPDPHPASAAAVIDGVSVISSVMPWPRAVDLWPWGSTNHTERMAETAEGLSEKVGRGATIWGGDWNTPLTGNIAGFTRAAQVALLDVLRGTPLQVPTINLPAKNGLQTSIDHIAVPKAWSILAVARVQTGKLSDHDAYWVDVDPG